MGSMLAKLTRGPQPYDLSARPLTEEEKTQLINVLKKIGVTNYDRTMPSSFDIPKEDIETLKQIPTR